MIILDTSTLIRFFTNDDAQKASKVKKLIESKNTLYVPEVVFPELEYVLSSHYHASHQEIIKTFRFLIAQSNITINPVVKIAADIFSNSKLDMADSIISAHVKQKSANKLASFDQELTKITGQTIW